MLTIICHQKAKKSKNLTSDQYRELSKRIKETYIFTKKKLPEEAISLVLSNISDSQTKKKKSDFFAFLLPYLYNRKEYFISKTIMQISDTSPKL